MNHNRLPSWGSDKEKLLVSGDLSGGIPEELLADVTEESVSEWLNPENLKGKHEDETAGYKLVRTIDGNVFEGRKVTLVRIVGDSRYPPHRHLNSDAVFIIIEGSATLLGDGPERKIGAGDIVPIPRGTAHGFALEPGEELKWVSIQYPPIHNAETGEDDLHFD